MTPKQQQIKKLLALALDPRGNDAECEAAGAKAIVLARAEKLSPDKLSRLLASPVRPRTSDSTFRPVVSPLDRAFEKGMRAAAEAFADDLKRCFR